MPSLKITSFLLTALLFLSTSNAIGGGARVLRSGEGNISIRGLNDDSWPEGYSLKVKSKQVARILSKEIGPKKRSVLETWSPEKFTSLSNRSEGESLDHFTFLVHGLELKHLIKEIDNISFDDFVKKELNPAAPTGDDFIPYYPYFFHKKTIVSASVVSENLTATFGNLGFILSVPANNFLFGANKDIHSPTDKDFYIYKDLKSPSDGDEAVKAKLKEHPLPLLQDLIPRSHSIQRNNSIVTKKRLDLIDQYTKIAEKIPEEEAKEMIKARNPDWPPEKLQVALNTLRYMVLLGSFQRMEDKLTTDEKDNLAIKMETSVYNEVALIPASKVYKSALITGVFLRTAESDLQDFLKKTHVKKLMDVAQAFDLPVVFIDDGNIYNANIPD